MVGLVKVAGGGVLEVLECRNTDKSGGQVYGGRSRKGVKHRIFGPGKVMPPPGVVSPRLANPEQEQIEMKVGLISRLFLVCGNEGLFSRIKAICKCP